MIVNQDRREVYYPDSDGKPMAESDLHRDWMVRIIDMLKNHYRGKRVYATGNILVYYVEGNPKKSVSPDAMVVLDCPAGQRTSFKTWEEGVPAVAIEVTSRTTKRKDLKDKPAIYSQIGVAEYFMFDPTREYLKPQLQGFRLVGDQYLPIEAEADGSLVCRQLNLSMRLEGEDLTMVDVVTGNKLRTDVEQQMAEKEQARAERERERLARVKAEEEIERLKRLLEARDSSS